MKSVIYFDTSALAKWYISEAHSDDVEEYLQKHGPVAISDLTIVEMRCLLARRRLSGPVWVLVHLRGKRERPAATGRWPVVPASTSLASAFMLDLRVEEETPPTVVEPPEALSGGRSLDPMASLMAPIWRPRVSAATWVMMVRVPVPRS